MTTKLTRVLQTLGAAATHSDGPKPMSERPTERQPGAQLTILDRPERRPDGLLWKATHPIGEVPGATRFIGTTAISSAWPSSGTLTVAFHRIPGRPL